MVDDHDIRESKEVIESDDVVQRRCSMATNVPHDHSLCEQSVGDACWGFGPSNMERGLPSVPSPRNCSGIQRGSAHVTVEALGENDKGRIG